MKSFKSYLREANVTFEEALKLFGLKTAQEYKELSKDKLKVLYRKLATENHPDKGGNLQMMQKINSAYDILQRSTGEVSRAEREESRLTKIKVYAEISIDALTKNFDASVFKKYFEEIFEEKFESEIIITPLEKITAYASSVMCIGKFFNKDKTIALDVSYVIYLAQLFGSETSLGGGTEGDQDLNIYANTEILYNRKKLTLIRNRYSYDKNYSILRDPSKLFPRDKLVAQIKKVKNSVGSRTLKKADAILTLEKELGARVSVASGQVWAEFQVPLPKGKAFFQMYRSTMMGLASWGFNGHIKVALDGEKPTKELLVRRSVSVLETPESFDYLINGIKSIQGGCSTKEDVVTKIIAFIDSYTAIRERFYYK